MPNTYSYSTQQIADHLTGLGFTTSTSGRDFTHPRAVVHLIDDGVACITVRPLPRGEPPHLTWEVQLTRAPLDLVAATVAAALA